MRNGYLENLLALGEVTRDEAEEIARRSQERLDRALEKVGSSDVEELEVERSIWEGYVGGADGAEETLGGGAFTLTRRGRAPHQTPESDPERWAGYPGELEYPVRFSRDVVVVPAAAAPVRSVGPTRRGERRTRRRPTAPSLVGRR